MKKEKFDIIKYFTGYILFLLVLVAIIIWMGRAKEERVRIAYEKCASYSGAEVIVKFAEYYPQKYEVFTEYESYPSSRVIEQWRDEVLDYRLRMVNYRFDGRSFFIVLLCMFSLPIVVLPIWDIHDKVTKNNKKE